MKCAVWRSWKPSPKRTGGQLSVWTRVWHCFSSTECIHILAFILEKKSHSFICVKQKDEGRNLRHSGYKNKQNIGLFIEVDPKNVSILQIVSGEETVSWNYSATIFAFCCLSIENTFGKPSGMHLERLSYPRCYGHTRNTAGKLDSVSLFAVWRFLLGCSQCSVARLGRLTSGSVH